MSGNRPVGGSPGLSFDHPLETAGTIGVASLSLLEAIRSSKRPIRLPLCPGLRPNPKPKGRTRPAPGPAGGRPAIVHYGGQFTGTDAKLYVLEAG